MIERTSVGDEIHGHLYNHCETGTEGCMWAVEPNKVQCLADLVMLEEGDYLKVFGPDNAVLFDDIIKPDRQAGLTQAPHNPKYRQPSALGLWIHWTQSGWTPDAWASLFIKHDPPLRAVVVKGSANAT